MTKFIALRRKPRTESLSLGAVSFEARLESIAENVPVSEHTESLEALGLMQVEREEKVPDEANSFQRLGYVGAYVVETDSEAVAYSAAVELEPDYLIMPDVELSIPQPQLSQTLSRRPRRRPYWPDASGVNLAHGEGISGSGVLIGVLDTGCDVDHLELRDKHIEYRYVPLRPSHSSMRECRGFDTNGHGTHVCGIIAGKNVGVAPGVELMVASVIESETHRTSIERIVVGLNWMLSQYVLEENRSKPFIINMSLGFLPEWISGSSFQAVINGMKIILSTLVDDFGVLPVVAIGNEGPGKMRAPGYFPRTLSVGAVDFDMKSASFSGGGVSPEMGDPEPNAVGYGVNVLSCLERNTEGRSLYARMSGTSMATPYVTGIAALYGSRDPTLRGQNLRQRLILDAKALDEPPNRVGAGIIRFA